MAHKNRARSRQHLSVQHLEDRLAPAFATLGNEFQVNTWTTGHQVNKAVAMDALGNFVTVFNSVGQDGSGDGIFARRFDVAGQPLGNQFQVNTITTSEQSYPAVGMSSSGTFVVVWEGLDGSSSGVFVQRFDAAGAPQGPELRANMATSGRQGGPTVAVEADGDFIVAWSSVGQDGNNEGIYGRRYDAFGNAKAAEFKVNTFTTGNQGHARLAVDQAGNFVIAWASQAQDVNDLNGGGIYFQRFNGSGSFVGNESRANTFTLGNQAGPDVAIDSDGDFVIAWTSNEQDGSGYGVYGQRFNSTGAKQGDESVVNVETLGGQARPSVSIDAMGNYAITWHSDGGDNNSRGILARRYLANGSPIGSEFVVNSTTINHQSRPCVAMDSQGDSVVIWDSLAQDGDGYGIYGQRYGFKNTAPTFTNGANQVIGVNAGPQTINPWATNLSAGSVDESSQLLTFEMTGNSNPALFAAPPAISSQGTLTYAPANNLYGTATIQVRLHDNGGTANGGQDTSSVETFTITVLPPPQVDAVRINDGAIQRSRVGSLAITLNGIVSIIGNPATAIQVTRLNGGAVLLGLSNNVVNGVSVVSLNFSGAETEFASLRDGRYTVTIAGDQVVDIAGQKLLGNGPNNTFNYSFHRLFGDGDGNGMVNATDFAIFRSAFGVGPSIFDFNNDGQTSSDDFGQFRARFGLMI